MKPAIARGVIALAVFFACGDGGSASGDAEPGVFPNAESVQPLRVGAQVPAVSVRTVTGESVDLAALVRDRGALLVFYRGGW
jgi:hypothetical protein